MAAPIVLFTYNRARHLQACLRSLAAAEGAQQSDLYIFSDGARDSDADRRAVAEVRSLCRAVGGFAHVWVTERPQNMGLAQNVIEGVGRVMERHGEAIVVEDDLEVSPFFLRFMNSALVFYKGRGVFSVCGYSPALEIPFDYHASTYVMHRNGSWGWATWREQWQKVDWGVATFDAFIRDPRARARFNECGNDLSPMLLRWKTGEIASWSIRFCYAAFVAGQPTVYPRKSLVRNRGVDGSGSNVPSTHRYDVPMAANVGLQAFTTSVAPDPALVRQFRAFYDTSAIRRLINCFKRWRYLVFKC